MSTVWSLRDRLYKDIQFYDYGTHLRYRCLCGWSFYCSNFGGGKNPEKWLEDMIINSHNCIPYKRKRHKK